MSNNFANATNFIDTIAVGDKLQPQAVAGARVTVKGTSYTRSVVNRCVKLVAKKLTSKKQRSKLKTTHNDEHSCVARRGVDPDVTDMHQGGVRNGETSETPNSTVDVNNVVR